MRFVLCLAEPDPSQRVPHLSLPVPVAASPDRVFPSRARRENGGCVVVVVTSCTPTAVCLAKNEYIALFSCIGVQKTCHRICSNQGSVAVTMLLVLQVFI